MPIGDTGYRVTVTFNGVEAWLIDGHRWFATETARDHIDRLNMVRAGADMPIGYYEELSNGEREEWAAIRDRRRAAEEAYRERNKIEQEKQIARRDRRKEAIKNLCTPWELKYFNDSDMYESYVRINSKRFPGFRWRFYASSMAGNIKIQKTKSNRIVCDYVCFHTGKISFSDDWCIYANILNQVTLVKNGMDDLIVARGNGDFTDQLGEMYEIHHSYARRKNIIEGYLGNIDSLDGENIRYN